MNRSYVVGTPPIGDIVYLSSEGASVELANYACISYKFHRHGRGVDLCTGNFPDGTKRNGTSTVYAFGAPALREFASLLVALAEELDRAADNA